MFEALARIVACGVLISLATVARAQTTHGAAAASATSAPPKAMVVVISTRSKGGPNLSRDTASLVEAPLARSATIVSYGVYKTAARTAGHTPKELADIDTIRAVSPAVGITHAVVVEGSTSTEVENGKSVKVKTVEISLLDATTGAVLYTTKRTLTGKHLTRSVSTPVVAAIAEKLTLPPPAPPQPEPPQPEPPMPVVPVPPPPQVEQSLPLPDRDSDDVLDDKDACADVAGIATDDPKTNGCPPSLSTPVEATPAAVDQTPVRSGDVNMNPILQAHLGIMGLGRAARVHSNDGRVAYNGPLIAPNLQVAYFPFARRDARDSKHPKRGVGLYGEGYLARETAHFKPMRAEHTSTVGGFEVGGAFRFPLALSENAPVITLQLGYAYSSWQLSGVIFPGVRYSSPEVGFVVDAPIASHVAVFVGGKFMPWMSMGGQANRLGKQDTGLGMRGDLGVRFVLAPFELALTGRYTQYNADFIGATSLGIVSELSNVSYVDRYYGGMASLGYSF